MVSGAASGFRFRLSRLVPGSLAFRAGPLGFIGGLPSSETRQPRAVDVLGSAPEKTALNTWA